MLRRQGRRQADVYAAKVIFNVNVGTRRKV